MFDSLKLLLLLHTPAFISAPGSTAKRCILSESVLGFQFRILSVWWLHGGVRSGFMQGRVSWCELCPWQGDSAQGSAPAGSEEHLPAPAAVSQAALVLVLHNKSLCVLPHGALSCSVLNPHRYGVQVMEKVLKMAEGIDIGETRSYELVPNRKLKRYRSPSDSECTCLCQWPLPCPFGWPSLGAPMPRGRLRDRQHSRLGEVPVVCSALLDCTAVLSPLPRV